MTREAANPPRSDNERVYLELRREIIEGRYAPGARIVEQAIAGEMDVSRTPVREAVRRLESEGLVVVERNRGAQVRPLSEDDVLDLYEVRARLEAFAAELAASRGEPEEMAGLRAAAERFGDLAGRSARTSRAQTDLERARALTEANADFHDRLASMGRAERIRRLIAGAVDVPLVFQALHGFTDDELERSSLFHHLIADAVAGGSPQRASRLMTEHVLQGRDALLARLSDPDRPKEVQVGA